jgi:hypothetical protein
MTLAQWLDQQGNISDSLNVTLTIRGIEYKGAVYTVTGDGPDDPCIYILGEMPKQVEKIAFRFDGDTRDWYVASHFQENQVKPGHSQYHPFGKSWILHPWNSDEPIDHYENKPLPRVKVEIR